MTADHYATLGLSPTSQDVVIRAAYVALIRLYHPDRNPSAEAAAHTRAINDAYAVLGDPDRRAEYDKLRMEAAWTLAPPPKPKSPTALFAAAALTLLALAVFLFVRSPLPSTEQPFGTTDGPGAEMAALEPGAPGLSANPLSAIGGERTRGRPPTDKPPTEPQLPLPPPMARVASQPAAPPKARVAVEPAAVQPSAVAAETAATPPKARVAGQATAFPPRPSFSCRFARTRGEIAVCRNGNLANLDRQQALLYSQSWGRADAAKRTQLLRSHGQFVARRDGCRSDSCTSEAYLARMREVSAIMMAR